MAPGVFRPTLGGTRSLPLHMLGHQNLSSAKAVAVRPGA